MPALPRRETGFTARATFSAIPDQERAFFTSAKDAWHHAGEAAYQQLAPEKTSAADLA